MRVEDIIIEPNIKIIDRYSSICDTRDSIYRYAIDKTCIKSKHEYVE